MHEVVPAAELAAFSPRELALLLGGVPEIDVADWRAHTRLADNLPPDDPLVAGFWDAVASFGPDQRVRSGSLLCWRLA